MSADDWIAVGTMLLFVATLLGAIFVLMELRNGHKESEKANLEAEKANIRAKKQATVDFATQTLDRRIYWQSDLPHPRDSPAIKLMLDDLKDNPDSEGNKDRRNKIRSYLGFWELTAVALKHNVFDVQLFHDMLKTHFLQVVRNYREFMDIARAEFGDDSKQLYVEMEKLADKWNGKVSADQSNT